MTLLVMFLAISTHPLLDTGGPQEGAHARAGERPHPQSCQGPRSRQGAVGDAAARVQTELLQLPAAPGDLVEARIRDLDAPAHDPQWLDVVRVEPDRLRVGVIWNLLRMNLALRGGTAAPARRLADVTASEGNGICVSACETHIAAMVPLTLIPVTLTTPE